MRSSRLTTFNGALLFFLVAVGIGCPRGRGELSLVVEPLTLDYGGKETTLPLTVRPSLAGNALYDVRLSSTQTWLEMEKIQIPILSGSESVAALVDRRRLADFPLGTQTCEIIVSARGISAKTVTASVDVAISVSIIANKTTLDIGEEVQFTGQASFAGSSEGVQWAWYFGDEISQEPGAIVQNPVHAYSEPGIYTVSLNVTTPDARGSRTRIAYVNVAAPPEPPRASFAVSSDNPLVNEPIRFTDTSSPGSSPIAAWLWQFDISAGAKTAASTVRNPVYTFTEPGAHAVTLTVTNEEGLSDTSAPVLITAAALPPVAGFSASTRSTRINQSVTFADTSTPGTAPITVWEWRFGDGLASIDQNPVHSYAEAGVYDVSLTVRTNHGTDTETKAGFITIVSADITQPVADFEADRTAVIAGDPVQFTDLSVAGSTPITMWLWDFGDGTASNAHNPSHLYAAGGHYTVSLAVFSDGGTDVAAKTDYIHVSAKTPLDEMVREPDPNYRVLPYSGTYSNEVHVGVWSMRSQGWQVATVDVPLWNHWLTIIRPDAVNHDTALLVLAGGDNSDAAPDLDLSWELYNLYEYASATNSLVAYLQQVPNQPLTFTGDPTHAYSNDALVAFSLDKYLDTQEDTWPVLLPMVKSAIRAMDTVQALYASDAQQFVVTGAGIRGWTTWLAGATDNRVVGIAPIGFDALNLEAQLAHQYNVYGGYSEALQDYVDFNVFGRLDTAAGQTLLGFIDPYSYTDRYSMPKLCIGSAGDEFWVPDAARFYFDDLPGVKHLLYYPDLTHDELVPEEIVWDFAAWYLAILHDEVLPSMSATRQSSTGIEVETTGSPTEGNIRSAISDDRDFRADATLNPSPPVWDSTLFDPSGMSTHTLTVTAPGSGWKAFYGEFYFDSDFTLDGIPAEYLFTTPVYVTPDTPAVP